MRIMREIGFLGTGGSFATADRDNASLLLPHEDGLLLVDCPGGVVHKIQKLGFEPAGLSAILITHAHTDHLYGFPGIFHGLMLRDGRIDVYASEETLAVCRALLDAFGLDGASYRMRAELHPVRAGAAFRLRGGAEVQAWSVRHHSSSLAFRLEGRGRTAVFMTGDTPADPDLLAAARPFDVLVHDCSAPSRVFDRYPGLRAMHTSAADLGRLADAADVQTLVPIHFFGEVPFGLDEVETEIRHSYAGRLIIPRDFDKVTL
jgi:ribonuclease Z